MSGSSRSRQRRGGGLVEGDYWCTPDGRDENVSQLQTLQVRAFNTAQEHGFTEATFGEQIALIHSEVSEALEAYREGFEPGIEGHEADGKPVGVPSELADAVIRILDTCERNGINLERAIEEKMAYNDTRSFRHGGKSL